MALSSDGTIFRLLVGLGNPGREYRDTRHNVGFMILDLLAAQARTEFRPERAWQSEVARSGDVFFCKPQTFMNRSGESVKAICQFYKIAPEETLIVLDDMALPLGTLRLRPSGSSGGQKGLESVIAHLGTQSVPRLRVGIGAAQPGSAVGHVLGRFSPAEQHTLEDTLIRATQAIDCARSSGLQAAMNSYN